MGDRLKDKVALVSGAGSGGPGWGNGKATAVLFAREGAKVLAADINRDAALETKRIIDREGGICEAVSADVSRADDVAAMIDACIAAFGRIDVLHNNVGIVEVGGPVETTEESWDRVNDVNLKSMFLTCKQALPHMERQGKGAIVNIASVSGIRWLGVPYISYAASKAAVIQFTRVIALQYARSGKSSEPKPLQSGKMRSPQRHDARPDLALKRVLQRVAVTKPVKTLVAHEQPMLLTSRSCFSGSCWTWFLQVRHYYRPPGLPRHKQWWLATVWRKG